MDKNNSKGAGEQRSNSQENELQNKYKVFYENAKDEYTEIHDNYFKIVDKASKYLQFLSIVVGAILFGAKWYLDTYEQIGKKESWITVVIIVLGLTSIIELVIILMVMFVKDFGKVILKVEDEVFFIDNNLTQIYSGLGLRYIETNLENFIHIEKKGRLLRKSQWGLIILLFLVFGSIILLYIKMN